MKRTFFSLLLTVCLLLLLPSAAFAEAQTPAPFDALHAALAQLAEDNAAPEKPKEPIGKRIIGSLYDIVEMLGVITVIILLCFSFVVRLNVVDGPSMENTLILNPAPTVQYLRLPLLGCS